MGWAVEVMAERAEEAFCERHGIQPDGATGRRDSPGAIRRWCRRQPATCW